MPTGIGGEPLSGERRFELLVNSVHDYAIYMLDPQGIVTSWNPGVQRFKGYTAAEIIGQHFSRFYTDDDQRAGVPQRALSIASIEGKFEAEGWRIRKDGTRFWAHVIIDPIRDDAGKLIGFAKITRDVTERKQAQEALQQSEARFRLLVQGVIDYAIFMLDATGHVTNWNSGAQRMKGYAAEEIVGEHFSRFYTAEDRAAGIPLQGLRTAEQTGKFETEGWRLRKDGTRFWASVVIDAIRDDNGRLVGFAKVTRDITERKLAQEALEETRAALFQAQKMEAVGQLTGGIAHDFNNLLQAIGGSLDVIERRLMTGRGDIEAYVTAARTSVDRAKTLTQRLLAFSRRQPLQPERTDLRTLVDGLRDLIERSVGEAIRVETRLAPELWPIWADANQVEAALLNLAINARDAMPHGGQLTIQGVNVHLDATAAASETGVLPGDYTLLEVADTGTGMPPNVLDRAFEPFFTTKPLGQGTGLGLSQIYGFARQSGGYVRIDSEVGHGTSVKLYLPRSHEAETLASVPAKPPDQPQQPVPGTVLVVEDEPIVRMLLVEALREQGATVWEAEDGNEALAILNSPVGIDLLVTDVGLPGITGQRVAETARSLRPDLKIIFLTGYTCNAVLDKELLAPHTRLLSKPIAIDQFLAQVNSMLRNG
ncbi:PAS domain-containing sensor histidine kinase (plasmid) [Azospirillum argentinense]|uniref:histidine kinase n=1 Tax=Azospirillum argentinense TaxID=2970906 RepID=A0A4D8PJZ4_9PROT|nr:PAS domain-containing sensor histidine kinase [Azospirillum argentinense]QCN98833.1 PAS domain-containing sensor histidine kinase [Azospirillum argentinense]